MRVFPGIDWIFQTAPAVQTCYMRRPLKIEATTQINDKKILDLTVAIIIYAALPRIQTQSADIVQLVICSAGAIGKLPFVNYAAVLSIRAFSI